MFSHLLERGGGGGGGGSRNSFPFNGKGLIFQVQSEITINLSPGQYHIIISDKTFVLNVSGQFGTLCPTQ